MPKGCRGLQRIGANVPECLPSCTINHHDPSVGDQFPIRRERMSYISRGRHSRSFSKTTLPGLLVAAALALPTLTLPTWAQAKTLTAVMHSDLRAIDPI